MKASPSQPSISEWDSMSPTVQWQQLQTRRRFLKWSAMGLGGSVLGHLIHGQETSRGLPTRHAPRAKRVIFLFMAGAPSQLDLFDYKPDLHKQFNQPLPPSVSNGQRVTAMTRAGIQRIPWMSLLRAGSTRHSSGSQVCEGCSPSLFCSYKGWSASRIH